MRLRDCCRPKTNEEEKVDDKSKPEIKLTPKIKRDQRKKLAEEEENWIWWVRRGVFVVCLLAGAGLSYLVYSLAQTNEEDVFQQQFDLNADLVIDAVVTRIGEKIQAMQALALDVTTTAINTGQQWPQVLLPDFAHSAANTRVHADAALIFLLPYVTDENRISYEEYTSRTFVNILQDFLREQELRDEQDARYGITAQRRRMQQPNYNNGIFSTEENPLPKGSGPYFPIWQSSPVFPNTEIINLDLSRGAVYKGAIEHTLQSNQTVIGLASNLIEGNANTLYQLALQLGQHRQDPLVFFTDPISRMIYPVFNSTTEPHSLVGILAGTIYFRALFDAILPESAKGYIAVLSNTQGQIFTYLIDGPEVYYAGRGDLHRRFGEFEEMVRSAEINSLVSDIAGPPNRGYTTADFDDSFNRWTLTLYPSEDTKAVYVTSGPTIYAICTAALFLFTAGVCYLYDRKVARRQQCKMEEAVAKGIIKVEFFPEEVGEQMCASSKETEGMSKYKEDTTTNENETAVAVTDPGVVDASKPIADIFERTTVLCADIDNFADWSALQIPSDVFIFLERLHEAFDALAEERKVYSIETSGDLCVAVAGLPESQNDHAERMVMFSRDMIERTGVIVDELIQTAGLSKRLEMRIGLHSGATTAGVLRGQRSRYHIVGETLDIAREVMVRGIKGRIHASGAVVDALAQTGHKHWAKKRKTKFSAHKNWDGQTFWIDSSLEKPEESEHGDKDATDSPLTSPVSPKRSFRGSGSSTGPLLHINELPVNSSQVSENDDEYEAILNSHFEEMEQRVRSRMSFM